MSFTEAIKTGFQKYADFSGRASRSEFWWFILFTIIARMLAALIPGVGFIVGLALLLPYLSVTARRLHDINRTGWWLLLLSGVGVVGMIPGAYIGVGIANWAGGGLSGMILLSSILALSGGYLGLIAGFLVMLPFLIKPGDPGPNRYGLDPLQMPPGTPGPDYTNPGHPYAPPYNAAPPEPLPSPSGRQYCPQCGAARAAAAAQFCTVCGTEF